MIKKAQYFFIFLLIMFFAGNVFAKSYLLKKINNHEIELVLDLYYSNIGYYLPLTNKPIPLIEEENELNIYKHLFLSPIPSFLVFELSVNPMPCLGVLIKKNYEDIYTRVNITEKQNLIKSITAGFEEPYAASIFLGNVIGFRPKDVKKAEGKGYIGALFSFGDYHIKDNELVQDNWYEIELKIRGPAGGWAGPHRPRPRAGCPAR